MTNSKTIAMLVIPRIAGLIMTVNNFSMLRHVNIPNPFVQWKIKTPIGPHFIATWAAGNEDLEAYIF